MAEVQSVPLFSMKAVTSFVSKADDDFERMPLLTIGCFALLASQFEKWRGCDWSDVVDLGGLGVKLSSLTDYWELVDFLKGARKALAPFLPIYMNKESGDETSKLSASDLAKQTALFACKAISNGANFILMFDQCGALQGARVQEIKLVGTGCGSLAFSNILYACLTTDATDPERVETLNSEEAKEIYRAQHTWKALCDCAAIASILAMKTIGFLATVYAFYNGPGFLKFVADRQNGLLLTSFTTFGVAMLGEHFLGEQMKEFQKLNQA